MKNLILFGILAVLLYSCKTTKTVSTTAVTTNYDNETYEQWKARAQKFIAERVAQMPDSTLKALSELGVVYKVDSSAIKN